MILKWYSFYLGGILVVLVNVSVCSTKLTYVPNHKGFLCGRSKYGVSNFYDFRNIEIQ